MVLNELPAVNLFIQGGAISAMLSSFAKAEPTIPAEQHYDARIHPPTHAHAHTHKHKQAHTETHTRKNTDIPTQTNIPPIHTHTHTHTHRRKCCGIRKQT